MTSAGELYVNEDCKDFFEDDIDKVFGHNCWKLDGSNHQASDPAFLDGTILVRILSNEENDDGDFDVLATAIIVNDFDIRGDGGSKYINITPRSIKIGKRIKLKVEVVEDEENEQRKQDDRNYNQAVDEQSES